MSSAPRAADLPILGPCPSDVDLESDPDVTRAFCQSCRKDVHLLSHMTRSEAERFLASRAGERLCVSYEVDAFGAVRFRSAAAASSTDRAVPRGTASGFVPVMRLAGRATTSPPFARAAATASLAALAVACTPTSRPEDARADAALREPPRVVVSARHVEGGSATPSVDEPCDDPPPLAPTADSATPGEASPKPTVRPPRQGLKRGMMVSRRMRGDVALPD